MMATTMRDLDCLTVVEDTAPSSHPVTLAEVKEHCRVIANDDDIYLTALIALAVQHVQFATHRQLMSATCSLYLDEWPAIIEVPRPPLTSVTSVKYYDSALVQQTLVENTDYLVDTKSTPGRITTVLSVTWPTVYDIWNAIAVKYVCGYASAAVVPENLKHAIKFMVAHWYNIREPVGVPLAAHVVPYGVDMILAPFVVPLP